MNESLILAWPAGAALGALFFGGLWWTIRRALASPQPAVWLFGSLVVRMSAALAGVYFVAGGAWPRAVLCLLGFVMARQLVLRLARRSAEVSP